MAWREQVSAEEGVGDFALGIVRLDEVVVNAMFGVEGEAG